MKTIWVLLEREVGKKKWSLVDETMCAIVFKSKALARESLLFARKHLVDRAYPDIGKFEFKVEKYTQGK